MEKQIRHIHIMAIYLAMKRNVRAEKQQYQVIIKELNESQTMKTYCDYYTEL